MGKLDIDETVIIYGKRARGFEETKWMDRKSSTYKCGYLKSQLR